MAVQADDADPEYASRAGHKLAGALDALGADGPVVAGRQCLDAGASTGGFTDVLLRRGATRVVAVDVGHDQLVDALRQDPRVDVREGVNVRTLARGRRHARAGARRRRPLVHLADPRAARARRAWHARTPTCW